MVKDRTVSVEVLSVFCMSRIMERRRGTLSSPFEDDVVIYISEER